MAASASKDKPHGDPERIEMPSEFIDLMLCPICYELPEGPIHNCESGHVICSKCRLRVPNCAFCKTAYTSTSRNYPLEAMSQFIRSRKVAVISDDNNDNNMDCNDDEDTILDATMISCPYREEGCKVRLLSEDIMKMHKKICQYRPIKCRLVVQKGSKLRWETRCYSSGDGKVSLKDYFSHLQTVHGVQALETSVPGYFVKEDNVFTELEINVTWPLLSMSFDGKQFLREAFIHNRIVGWRVFLIGPEREASVYEAEIKILGNDQNGIYLGRRNLICETTVATISVLPVRSLRSVQVDEPEAKMTTNDIKYYCIPQRKDVGMRTAQFTWKMSIQIRKRVTNGVDYIGYY